MNNRVIHFEIPCDNPEQTVTFFKDVFGWSFQQHAGQPYWLATTGSDGSGGINGAIMSKQEHRKAIVNTISVDDIDAHAEKISQAGGKIVTPKYPIPGLGWIAYFTDPDGNTHGLWQLDAKAGITEN